MSRHEYEASKSLSKSDPPFYALIMAAMLKADSQNIILLRAAWPEVWEELEARYNSPDGELPTDEPVSA